MAFVGAPGRPFGLLPRLDGVLEFVLDGLLGTLREGVLDGVLDGVLGSAPKSFVVFGSVRFVVPVSWDFSAVAQMSREVRRSAGDWDRGWHLNFISLT